jgi:hypothetical protein
MSGSPKYSQASLTAEREARLARERAAAAEEARLAAESRAAAARQQAVAEAMLYWGPRAASLATGLAAGTAGIVAGAAARGLQHAELARLRGELARASNVADVWVAGRHLEEYSREALRDLLARAKEAEHERRRAENTELILEARTVAEALGAQLQAWDPALRRGFDSAGAARLDSQLGVLRAAVQAGNGPEARRAAAAAGLALEAHHGAIDRRWREHTNRIDAFRHRLAQLEEDAAANDGDTPLTRVSPATLPAVRARVGQARGMLGSGRVDGVDALLARCEIELRTAVVAAEADEAAEATRRVIAEAHVAAFRELGFSVGDLVLADPKKRASDLVIVAHGGMSRRVAVSVPRAGAVRYLGHGFPHEARPSPGGRTEKRCDALADAIEGAQQAIRDAGEVAMGALDWTGRPAGPPSGGAATASDRPAHPNTRNGSRP